MHANRSKYLVLAVFIASILLIVFLQFNSGRSIEDLVKGNKNLLHELQVQAQLQKLETEIIYIESSIRGFVITQDSVHLQGVTADINHVQKEVDDLNIVTGDTASSELLQQLSVLIREKILHSNQILDAFFKKGKKAAEYVINTNRGKIIRDSISYTVQLINLDRQAQLSNITASVNSNGLQAKSWGIILAVLACLASVITFWYLISQGQRQQKLIKTLDKSERQLKEASKIKEQFVANISHEIRTPMNAVLGFAGLLQKTTLDKNQHEYVKSIRSSAENLLTIINDILDLSRIESGMMRIENLPFNLRELLDSLATMLNVKAKNRGLYLRTEVDDSVPENLRGDAVRLTQILMNLISNALKFTHEGGVVVRLEKADTKDKTVFIRFIISDTGIGISEEKQRSVFDRFQQAQTETTRRYGGTGLGLSIVKQLVEIQNGTITLQSQPGKGSIFTVLLPYEVAAEAEMESISPMPVLVGEPLLQKIKLLVAEDNLMNQKLIQHLMQQWQIDFDIVSNGAAAVETLKRKAHEYNLVLMDIQMPEMDGYAATEKIRYDLNLSIPIIAMTAHALAGEKEKCLGAGMDDYISKPLNEEHLYRLIRTYSAKITSPTASVINMEYLRSISKGDKAFERNMIRAFSSQMPLELKQLKTAIEDKNYKRIGTIAHSMKSTVSYMGLQYLTPLLQEIETESENQNGFARINDNFISIDATCQLAIKEAHDIISVAADS